MLKRLFDNLLNIIYPKRCLICKDNIIMPQKKHNFLCNRCFRSIKKNIPPFCICCGRHMEENPSYKVCKNCQDKTYYFDRVYSVCVYEGIIKEIIQHFKYRGRDYLGDFLADLMIDFINTYKLAVQEFDFVAPIPLHPTKMRLREYNQSSILAEKLCKKFNLLLLRNLIYKTKNTLSQTELDAQARLKNVSGAFKINPKIDLQDKNILIIDDLLTTGATCSEVAKILKSKGARKVTVFTLAS